MEPSSKNKIGKWGITWIVLWAFTLLMIIFALPFGIFLLFVFAIAFPISRSSKKEKERKEKWGIPLNAPKVQYYGGCDSPLHGNLYFSYDTNSETFNFWEALKNEKKGLPKKIEICKNDIIAFTTIGDLTQITKTTGGGTSLLGAAAGAVTFGATGAIIGSRKKAKTTTETKDTRKAVIKYKDGEKEKSFVVSHAFVYDALAQYATEKAVG
mgnify:CR=1 FL=1